ncbi:hypothetical protein [Rhodococcus kronopolitis]|uniref:DUF3180 domain-containing protein n=1 Tax=Rhodococcus kronopolitis TaxID=1460226 RepID=A0ABV9FPU9_9NOCA
MFTAVLLLALSAAGYVGYRRLRADAALRADVWARVRTYALAIGLAVLAVAAVRKGPTGETALVLALAAAAVLPLAKRATALDRATIAQSRRRAQLGLAPRRTLVNAAALQARWVAGAAVAYFCIGGFRGVVELTGELSQHGSAARWLLPTLAVTAAAAGATHVALQRRRITAEDDRLDALDRAVG